MLLLALLPTGAVYGQSVKLYSEFRRIGSDGEIIAADRGGKPREILSPAVVRNSFYSLRIAVQMPEGKPYTLYLSQNPEDTFQLRLYRELTAAPGSAIRDRLEPVALPVQGVGGSTDSYWLDVWVPAMAPVRRIRLEAQLFDGEGWFISPMEVRVLAAIVMRPHTQIGAVAPLTQSADATARQLLRNYLCGETAASRVEATKGYGIRQMIRRNALQDLALARSLESSWGKEKLAQALAQAAGGADVASWCSQAPASAHNPEWYLRVRDFLYREASH